MGHKLQLVWRVMCEMLSSKSEQIQFESDSAVGTKVGEKRDERFSSAIRR